MSLFVDNSNLWIEGKKFSGQCRTPIVESNYYYRIEYGKLLEHVLASRPMGDVPRLYGSEPPPNDSVWKIIRRRGFDVQVFKRNIFNKEKGVDMKMGVDITKLICRAPTPAIIAIVAGDADFVPVVEEAKGEGWEVEVWYWSNAAADLKARATKYCELNPAINVIGFEEGVTR